MRVLKSDGKGNSYELCRDFHEMTGNDDTTFNSLVYSNIGKFIYHSTPIQESENPYISEQHELVRPQHNVSMQCPSSWTYHDRRTLIEWLLPQLLQDRKTFTVQQDGAPTYLHVQVLLVQNDSLVQLPMVIRHGCDRRRGNPTSMRRIILWVRDILHMCQHYEDIWHSCNNVTLWSCPHWHGLLPTRCAEIGYRVYVSSIKLGTSTEVLWRNT
jgi:hypothetical protein